MSSDRVGGYTGKGASFTASREVDRSSETILRVFNETKQSESLVFGTMFAKN